MDLVEISPEMAKILLNLKNFARNCAISWFGRVSSGFREKTRHPTHRFQILEAETRCRPSLVSSRPVLKLDQTGFLGESGLGCCWTPLNPYIILGMEWVNGSIAN